MIFPDFRPVNLNYKAETLSITPALLGHDSQSDALFAVRGLSGAVDEFSREVVLKVNGEALDSNLSLMSVETSCGVDVHFIGVNIPGLNAWPDNGVGILVPGSNAMFDMQIRYDSIQ